MSPPKSLSMIFVATLLLSTLLLSAHVYSKPAERIQEGPFVDRMIWKVIPEMDVAVMALKAGEVDIINERIPGELVPALLGVPGVTVDATPGLAFRHLTLNNAKFPFNYSEFRRALAYAIDKHRIALEATAGYAVATDSPVPWIAEPWSYEPFFEYKYYDPMPDRAREELERAGFRDIDGDGWVEGPRGEEIVIELTAAAGYEPAIKTIEIAAENFEAVGIRSVVVPRDFKKVLELMEKGVHDIVCFTWMIGPEPDHLFDLFRSGQTFHDLCYRWYNSEYDAVVDKMMAAVTKEEALKWAHEAQKILHREVPIIPVYADTFVHGFRTDRWEGYVDAKGYGVANYFTWIRARLKPEYGGPFGGEFRVAVPEPFHSTNVLATISGYDIDRFSLIYDYALIGRDPYTWEDIPALAYDWTVEVVEVEGIEAMKVSLKLLQNVTWHDGTKFTAHDVNFTIRAIQYAEVPYFYDWVRNIFKIEIPDDYTIVLYSSKPGYFEFRRMVSGYPILPKHIWEPRLEELVLWIPAEPDEMIGTGPYRWVERKPGEYLVVERNPDYYYAPRMPLSIQAIKTPISGAIGEVLAYEVKVVDVVGRPLVDAMVEATVIETGEVFTLIHIGEGIYTFDLDTTGYAEGTYTIEIKAERAPYIPETVTVSVELALEALQLFAIEIPVSALVGEVLTYSVKILDPFDRPVTDAVVKALVVETGEVFTLSHVEGGVYTFDLDTTGYAEGVYTIEIRAERAPFAPKMHSGTLELTAVPAPPIWPIFVAIAIAIAAIVVAIRIRRS